MSILLTYLILLQASIYQLLNYSSNWPLIKILSTTIPWGLKSPTDGRLVCVIIDSLIVTCHSQVITILLFTTKWFISYSHHWTLTHWSDHLFESFQRSTLIWAHISLAQPPCLKIIGLIWYPLDGSFLYASLSSLKREDIFVSGNTTFPLMSM